jgi:hypothetical protein
VTERYILKFPNSRRRLTTDEERVVDQCVNLIDTTYKNKNPFIKDQQKHIQAAEIVRECIKKIFELNEDNK